MIDKDNVVEFISLTEEKAAKTKNIDGSEGKEWGKCNNYVNESYVVNTSSTNPLLTPLSFDNYTISRNSIDIKNSIIIHTGSDGFKTCLINKELTNVSYYYYCYC